MPDSSGRAAGGPSRPELGEAVQDVVYAGLEAMRASADLGLCAYLHAGEGQGPQLFLGVPDLGSIDPSAAFNLFSALRDALEDEHEGNVVLELGGFSAVAVTTVGDTSRGLHVFGRRGATLADEERAALVLQARAFGRVVHAVESVASPRPAQAPGDAPVRVAVDSGDGGAVAEVAVPLGEEIRTGRGEGATAATAVANAVIDAVDAGMKLVEAAEGDVAGERAVLVLVADAAGTTSLGCALITAGDGLKGTATAALEAIRRARR